MTRICVFGAGAIGGLIAAQLAHAGKSEVSVIARGANLDAIRAGGLILRKGGEEFVTRPRAAEKAAEIGPQDFVIIGLKAYALTGAIDALMPLLGPETAILFAQNGLPWWYFYGGGAAHGGRKLESVDPGGLIWDRLTPERAIGTVVWQAAELAAPGIVVHGYGDRMPVGEPSGEQTARVKTLSTLLVDAGFKSPVRPNLRTEIWLKLWGNLSFNPVSVLTRGTLEQLANDPESRRVIRAMMAEARAVAEAFGISFTIDIDERIGMAARVGAHRTSMLQDVDAGRPTELDALLGSVIELAQIAGMAVPTLQLVYDLVKARCRFG
ncbi:MAG: 2-dehydropantoate 2-reductase [Rhizobiales bacterium]|nr:2-dehydropantoate 2-reductase [Hyphomicrobiales bacterium]